MDGWQVEVRLKSAMSLYPSLPSEVPTVEHLLYENKVTKSFNFDSQIGELEGK